MLKRIWCVGCVAILLCSVSALAASPEEIWLTAKDGVQIRGDLYPLDEESRGSAPTILLFHQAGSNRGEYASIAPRLNELGFNALAIDQRSGGDRWGYQNETVEKLGESTDYLDALPDLEAALEWAEEFGSTGKTLIWGSSYSSALVFLLAAGNGEVDAILSFSPGEYLGSGQDEVRTAARKVTQPVLVLTPDDERGRAQPVVDAIAAKDKRFVVPDRAVHGSSMLVSDRNPGAAEVWVEVEKFLAPLSIHPVQKAP
jgi:dienelactone hydrolase